MLFRATVCAHGKNAYLCSAVGKLHLDLINNKTVFNKGY